MGNLGAIARLCANFQVENLIVVHPQIRLKDKVVYERATSGSRYIDNIIKLRTLDEVKKYCDYLVALTGIPSNTFVRNPIPIHEMAEKLAEKGDSHIGLVFGPESVGLSNEHLSFCESTAIIPLQSNEKTERILNISHAVAIALYEVQRASITGMRMKSDQLISREENDKIMSYYDDIIDYSLLGQDKQKRSRILFKNIINRAMLNRKEGHTFLGILRSILLAYERETHSHDNS